MSMSMCILFETANLLDILKLFKAFILAKEGIHDFAQKTIY
jgi:hypothetical protein